MQRLARADLSHPIVYTRSPRMIPRVEPDETAELRRLINVLIKGRWVLLAVAVMVIAPVAIWTSMQERLYRSSALIEIDPDPVQVLPYREIERPSLTANFEMFMKGQDQLLRSPALYVRIAERLKADPDAERLAPEVASLFGRLSVLRLENTYMFRVGYVAPDPEVAARIANIYAEEYIKSHFETRQKTREKAKELLEREIEQLEGRLQQSEKGLVDYAQKNKLSSGPTTDSPARAKLGQLMSENTQAEAEVITQRSQMELLEKATVEDFPPSLVTDTLSNLMAKALQVESDLTSLRGTFGENWPSVVAKRQEGELLQAQIQRERARALAQAREQARLDFTLADNKRALIGQSIAEQQGLVNQVESATVEYNIIRREVDTNQKMYEAMLGRLKQASVTTGMEFGGLQVVEPASPSSTVDSPKVVWNLLLASVLGMGLGICLVLGRDYWDTTVSTVDEVEQLTGGPVLGTVPNFRGPLGSRPRLKGITNAFPRLGSSTALVSKTHGRDERPIPVDLSSDPVCAESIRNVCASILLSQSEHPPRTLMVTSAVPAEGKTTMARELARAFTERGARTLLIECDLRRPTLGGIFKASPKDGLSMYLAGFCGDAPAVHEVHENFSLIVAGPPAPNPAALLNSDKMKTLLARSVKSYQFVILDAPPVIGLADSRVLAPMADGVVLVVRASKVAKTMLRRVCNMLESTGGNVIGAILNGAEGEDTDVTYGYYGYHGQDGYFGSPKASGESRADESA